MAPSSADGTGVVPRDLGELPAGRTTGTNPPDVAEKGRMPGVGAAPRGEAPVVQWDVLYI
jgi:hypothetical protein